MPQLSEFGAEQRLCQDTVHTAVTALLRIADVLFDHVRVPSADATPPAPIVPATGR
ncbi:hypothetical protein [Streptomyces sp. NPDC001652]|uniref:hypothetical protein n=1 Tax=Streptomyces sp. NPDC001652 TaxID=3154393 RepID=UPI003316DF88